jgi:hypothetical protein
VSLTKSAQITLSAALLCLSLAWGNPHYERNQKTMPLSQILTKLQKQGFSGVNEVGHDDGLLELKGVKSNGVEFKLYINPSSGEIVHHHHGYDNNENILSMLTVVKKIEAQGYAYIHEIEWHDGLYKVEAVNGDHQEERFYMDPASGAIVHRH